MGVSEKRNTAKMIPDFDFNQENWREMWTDIDNYLDNKKCFLLEEESIDLLFTDIEQTLPVEDHDEEKVTIIDDEDIGIEEIMYQGENDEKDLRCLRLMSSGTVTEIEVSSDDNVSSRNLWNSFQNIIQKTEDSSRSCPALKKSQQKSFICDWAGCDKRYKKSSHLKAHQRIHPGERPYKCTFAGCSHTCVRSDELTRHIRKHTGARPFVCNECSRTFTRSDHLALHKKRHDKNK